jgi:ASC-1-like (ASCH) protein
MTKRTFPTHNPPEAPVFDHLKSGKKTVEGRPYSKKYQPVAPGDTIVFTSADRKHKATVRSVKKYKTLKGFLRGEGLRKTLPGVKSVAEATQIYNKWSTAKQRSDLRKKYDYAMLAIRV